MHTVLLFGAVAWRRVCIHLTMAVGHPQGAGFNTTPKQPEQLSALTAGIAEALWQARMGPTAQLVLPEGEAGAAAGRLGYDQLSRAVATHSASSKEQLMVRGPAA